MTLLMWLMALAAEGALVLGPLWSAPSPDIVDWVVVVLAPIAFGVGVWRRSALALLAGVPIGWALAGAASVPSDVGATAAGIATGAAFMASASVWLRRRPALQALAWEALPDAELVPRVMGVGAVAGAVLAGPALAVVLWPRLVDEAMAGAPLDVGRALTALVLVAVVHGLVVASKLARGRAPRPGRRSVALVYTLLASGALTCWGLLAA